jgi:hypothetical protein
MASTLRFVQLLVGYRYHRFKRIAPSTANGRNPQADGHVRGYWGRPVRNRQRRDSLPQLLGNSDRTRGAGFRQDANKLLAAIAGAKVPGPADRRSDHLTNAAQAIIPLWMTVPVIEWLEVVYVEHDQRQEPVPPLQPGNFLRHHLVEAPPVGETGQGIGDGQMGHDIVGLLEAAVGVLLLGLSEPEGFLSVLLVGDVIEREGDSQPVVEEYLVGRHQGPAWIAACAAQLYFQALYSAAGPDPLQSLLVGAEAYEKIVGWREPDFREGAAQEVAHGVVDEVDRSGRGLDNHHRRAGQGEDIAEGALQA